MFQISIAMAAISALTEKAPFPDGEPALRRGRLHFSRARNDRSPLARTSSELLISTGEGKIFLDRHRQKIEKSPIGGHRRGYLSTRPPQDNAHKLYNC